MIEIRNVSKYYKTKTGVTEGIRNVNLKFGSNEFVAITGESGSGKTTLLNVLSGFDTYEDGEILIGGKETSHYTVKEWEIFRALNIGFVFQNYNIIESYSVYQNIIIALDAQGYDKEKRKERTLELIKEVGLENHIHHKTAKLSGGEKQRVVIARALAKDAPIILADEPTGNLDKKSGEEIMKLLKKISKDKLVLLVTHNFEEAKPYVTRKVVLEDGNVKDDQLLEKLSKSEGELVLNEEISKNTLVNSIKLAFRNIGATPKRTIFTFSLFLMVMIILLFFYSTMILSKRVDFYEVSNEVYLLNRDDSPFIKEDFINFKKDYESNYLKIYISHPELYGRIETYNQVSIRSADLLGNNLALEVNEVVIPKGKWSSLDYKVGDSIDIRIRGIEKSFIIKDFSDYYYIYVHHSLLYDLDTFTLNDKFFENSEINEILVVGYDREEINIFKSKLPNNIRIIDNYLQYEHFNLLQSGIFLIISWFALVGIMMILLLISYNVLKNTMQSRNKDFAVYRSVGVSEKEVALMIVIEQMFISLMAYAFLVISLKVLSKIFLGIYKIERVITFFDYFLISIFFLVFSLLQGLRFNKKLFNLTVIESLKEDH